MPQMGSGVRSSLRPHSGTMLATASPAAKTSPSSGRIPVPGASTSSRISATTLAPAGSTSFLGKLPDPSRRQRSNGPAAKNSIKTSATGTVVLSK